MFPLFGTVPDTSRDIVSRGWRVVLDVLHTGETALTGSGNKGVILNQCTEVSGGYFLMDKDRERPSCRLWKL
jgi:hypothetical protein